MNIDFNPNCALPTLDTQNAFGAALLRGGEKQAIEPTNPEVITFRKENFTNLPSTTQEVGSTYNFHHYDLRHDKENDGKYMIQILEGSKSGIKLYNTTKKENVETFAKKFAQTDEAALQGEGFVAIPKESGTPFANIYRIDKDDKIVADDTDGFVVTGRDEAQGDNDLDGFVIV